MDPLTIGLITGGLNAGMGIFGSIMGNNAEQARYAQEEQNYRDAKRFQRANDQFARWQAGFNARNQNVAKKYQYWAETVNYNQQKSYVNSQRNYETIKAIKQAEVVAQTRVGAMVGYIGESRGINNAYQEASIQDAVGRMQYRWRALQARASVQALEQEGNSVDRIVNDYSRQLGDYETLQNINAGLRQRQFRNEQAAAIANYLNQYNSQTFYEEQPFMDPLPPLAPLPTIVMPQPPSMTGAGPTRPANNVGLNIATNVINGAMTGLSAYGSMQGLKTPSGGGSGTGNLNLSGIRQYGQGG